MGSEGTGYFAAWLCSQLRGCEWPVAYLARSLGITRTAAHYWMTGRRVPSARRIVALAAALGVSPDAVRAALAHDDITRAPLPPALPEPGADAPERPFGPWLRARMSERRLDVGELARLLGTHRETVRAWATGARVPASVQVGNIAAALGVPVDEVRAAMNGEPGG